MAELEKVIKAMEEWINDDNALDTKIDACLVADALELLKEYKEHEELLTKLGYHWIGNGETLALCKRSKDGGHG